MANLSGADLSGADLSGAIFVAANLSGACLSQANLEVASLVMTLLSDADVSFVKYHRFGLYRGIRIATAYGDQRFIRRLPMRSCANLAGFGNSPKGRKGSVIFGSGLSGLGSVKKNVP